jgi:hypothetical protein
MKIQFHNLMETKTYNFGVAYLHPYKTIAVGLIICSLTICWEKEVRKN